MNGDGDLVAKVGTGRIVEADEAWSERVFASACRQPVTEAAYRARMADGRWPDEVAMPARNANAPASVQIAETIAELRREAEAWLKEIGGAVTTKEQADRAANYKVRFGELEAEAEKARKDEKEVHLKAGREVDATWNPVKDAGKTAKQWAAGLTEAYQKAERAQILAAAAEKAAQGQAVHPSELRSKVGTRGRGTTLVSYRQLKVTDLPALRAHYAADDRFLLHPDVCRVMTKLAMADMEAGKVVPGAEIEILQRAA